jgi:hydroxymethylpyrimidine pyrophosphatase-like HAD family hydrolase
MSLAPNVEEQLRSFLRQTSFASHGGVVTDLDGTAIHEYEGRISIPRPLELGLREVYRFGRPLILNTIRFPLSVIRTFGRDWFTISNLPIPTATLNGSLLGFVVKTRDDEVVFEEKAAFPLSADENEGLLDGVNDMLVSGVEDLLVFYYPRDWRMGEIIWTPSPEKVLPVKEKFLSASSVTATELATLRDEMLSEEICMVFLLIDEPNDRLMAYQHARRNSFVTRAGVDKLFGARVMADHLGVDLSHSLGVGDTEMDRFLSGVGLAVIVGDNDLPFEGTLGTIRLKDSFELGELLFRFTALQRALMT